MFINLLSEIPMTHSFLRLGALCLCTPLLVAACNDDPDPAFNTLPSGFNTPVLTTYDGTTDDLLTAGLGKTGIGSSTPPGFTDALSPTTAELRRRAIYTNYRALADVSAAGGYGSLYGPNIAADGTVTVEEGKIAGREFIAFADDGTGRKNVGMMVQIPDTFDPNAACIVTAPSPGSRGIYGAIGTSGEWGLKHGCAVAYTDAGKGIGYHDLEADKVDLIDGRLVARATAGTQAHFASDLAGAALAAYNAQYPNRFAYKHAHSQQNPEKNWGKNVLDSIRFALWAINETHAAVDAGTGRRLRTYGAANTTVIASSVSNGGGESLQAAEQDTEGLIDAVAVSEPNAQPASMTGVTVTEGATAVPVAGRPLADYFTYRMIYEPCAAISTLAQAPTGVRPGWLGLGTGPASANRVAGVELETIATNRCQSLAEKGLVTGATTADRADAALAKMHAYGWTDANHNALHASHYRLADIYVAMSYVAAYGKFSVGDNVCGFSLANVDASGNVAAQVPATQAILFGTGNGLATGGDVIYNSSVGGAKQYHVGVSPSTTRIDGSLDGLLCLRNLVTGVDTVTGDALTGAPLANSARVQAGIQEVLLTGNLRGKPAVIVTGRSDTLLPPNHTARAYAAYNKLVEGSASKLHYYEITNGQHFDAFNLAAGGVPGYDVLFIPLHHYLNEALDLMWAHLRQQATLPPSQLVRTVPRGGTPGAAPAIDTSNVPDIATTPVAGDVITVTAGSIIIPD
jgi:hydroxybutyrate-dimer hydrolase